MNTENSKSRITETSIGGTVYIVESLVSDNAKETAYTKVKRLIISNSKDLIKLSETTQLLSQKDYTSAK
ncbi:MAG: transposon-encoded TnpW family protein [Dialister sp.]|uniref:transposon-encoded TnpW family protein n=1 Tax=Dialister hominis TaxID=2582419 RepID=UPI00204A607C|nr:transposon-encoded TnpW family protein [Dialister sp.]MCH3929383.1 transposon-encoded TnpW family protein [Dialister sp.]UYJ16899.1 MAG: transposon-encoded TnpW family protein [Veillonellaceae bacterium]DAO41101.1 MAG TPA: transposon-encoded protein [Caudoviricetes sp.]